MIGQVDHRDRPLINLESDPPSGPLSALVDTGFNGHLITDAHNLDRLRDLGFSFVVKSLYQRIQTVSAAPRVQMGSARVIWHGESIRVPLYIVLDSTDIRRRGDAPITIGTRLLGDSTLTIDFPARSIVIERT